MTTVYVLPELDYDYDALEPHISAEIMKLHHTKHHQAYVDGANAALAALEKAREAGDLAAINLYEKNLAFHLGGHTNHSVFWKNMAPNAGGEPTGELAEAIDANFGSFDKFKAHFKATAMGLQGSGWAVLAYDTISGKLASPKTRTASAGRSASSSGVEPGRLSIPTMARSRAPTSPTKSCTS